MKLASRYPILIFLKKVSTLLSIVTILTTLTIGSIWVAGPRLFTLDNDKNILFSSSKIGGSKNQIYFAYFLPSVQKIQIFPLQSQLVEVMGDYGEYQLEAVYPLLKMEKKDRRFQLAAMSWGVGVVVDEISDFNSQSSLENKKYLQRQLKNMIIRNLTHPQLLVESLELFFFTRSVPIEQIKIETQPIALDQLVTSANSMIYGDCLVAVVNTTNKAGLAARMSTILEKTGAVVMRITDQNSPYQLSAFFYEDDNLVCQALVDRAASLFPTQIVRQDNPQLRQEYRADLVIFIGEDLAKKIN